ncbi:heterokaryon incompatibility protein-domain-containing protein [Xylariomycetidae sp. FL2044]|nr:heterokaryon incompatibility protein-domain-containing protein [Xylariomycetidae sp. FL2044]
MTRHRFSYLPLDRSIKSLRLVGFDLDDEGINLKIKRFPFANCPAYVALSYEWGPSTSQEHDITLTVESPRGPRPQAFSVRENLWAALHELKRLVKSPRDAAFTPMHALPNCFWIDAICINQADPLERGHQVNMMKDIFTSAVFSISWLGPADGKSDLAFRLPSGSAMEDLPPEERTRQLEIDRENHTGLRSLLQRSYWKRMWIVQEFLVPRDILILCGTHGMWFDALYDSYNRHPDTMFKDLESGWRLLQERGRRKTCLRGPVGFYTLDRLITEFGAGLCHDPRDRVFSLLSLVRRTAQDVDAGMMADYTITPTQLYCRTQAKLRRSPFLATRLLRHFFRETLARALCLNFNMSSDDTSGLLTPMHELPEDMQVDIVYCASEWDCLFDLRYRWIVDYIMPRLYVLKSLLTHRESSMGPQAAFERLLGYFAAFPAREDPETWCCFQRAVRAILGGDS